MNLLSAADRSFARSFEAGAVEPGHFDHRAHLRLAYVHLATHGADDAVSTFGGSLRRFLAHHQIDAAKFHATLTQAWLQAVWYFMQRCGDTADSEEFLAKCHVLHDPKVMLTHYSPGALFSDEARTQFVAPDLDPIPRTSRTAVPAIAS